VLAVLRAEAERVPAEGCAPTHFERAFGPLAFGDVWVRGKIDRIDVGDGRAVVLDYKTGSKKPLRSRSRTTRCASPAGSCRSTPRRRAPS